MPFYFVYLTCNFLDYQMNYQDHGNNPLQVIKVFILHLNTVMLFKIEV